MCPITKLFPLKQHEPKWSDDGRDKGEIWEGYGRDKKHPSRASAPVFTGLSEDLGRDERFFI